MNNDKQKANFTMPKALKKKWLAALRSGEYKQGQGLLYNPDNESYCCLGVLCAVTDGVIERGQGMPSFAFCESHGIKPVEREWAGKRGGTCGADFIVQPEFGDVETFLTTSRPMSADYLSGLNDDVGATFKEIANIIEERVEAY